VTLVIIGTIAIVVGTVAFGVVFDRKVGIAPKDLAAGRKASSGYAAGEAPSTAIRASAAQLARLRESQRCGACRAAMTGDPDDSVRYDDRELIVLQFRCPSCAAKRTIYVASVG
jgi:hypothetical protein